MNPRLFLSPDEVFAVLILPCRRIVTMVRIDHLYYCHRENAEATPLLKAAIVHLVTQVQIADGKHPYTELDDEARGHFMAKLMTPMDGFYARQEDTDAIMDAEVRRQLKSDPIHTLH